VQPGGRHRPTPAGQALQRPGIELRRCKRDPAVSSVQQVPGHRRCGIDLGEADTVHPGLVAQLHEVDARHVAGGEQRERACAVLEARHQHPGRAVQQLLTQQLLFLRRVVVGHADQGLVARRAQGALHGLEHVDEQRVGEHRDQQGDMVAVPRGEGACRRIGRVAEARRGRLHPRHQLRIDRTLSAQRARHGDRAHASRQGDIGERDAACGAGTRRRAGHAAWDVARAITKDSDVHPMGIALRRPRREVVDP
jgi:hypothetical protein